MPIATGLWRWFAARWAPARSAAKVVLAVFLVGAALAYAFFGPLVFDVAYWVLGRIAQVLSGRRPRIVVSVGLVAIYVVAVGVTGLTTGTTRRASPSPLLSATPSGPIVASATSVPATPTLTPAPTPTPTLPATATPSPTATPPPPTLAATRRPGPTFRTFGDGTYAVGTDIVAGTYRTREASPVCNWARLRGFGGTPDEIIANDYSDGPVVVTIAASDAGFQTNGCGTWTTDLSAILKPGDPLAGDGTYIVGTDFKPGTYRSPAHAGCYWARLRGFGGTYGELIDNVYTDAQAIVTIRSSDKGFKTSLCGPWTRQ
jgi:hypothetical protein